MFSEGAHEFHFLFGIWIFLFRELEKKDHEDIWGLKIQKDFVMKNNKI